MTLPGWLYKTKAQQRAEWQLLYTRQKIRRDRLRLVRGLILLGLLWGLGAWLHLALVPGAATAGFVGGTFGAYARTPPRRLKQLFGRVPPDDDPSWLSR